MVGRYLNICKALGYTISSERTALAILSDTREAVNTLYQRRGIDQEKPLVVLVPGGSFGPSKLWPPEYFAQTGDFLIEKYGVQVIVTAGPGEEAIALRIESLMRNRPFVFTPQDISLEYLKAIISDAALVVTNDTGPRHFAVAFGIPVVVMMGSTDPRYTNYDLGKTKIVQADLDCVPCQLKVCPTDNRCMSSLSVEKVVEACEEFLSFKRN
jgi:heptosyltransferase-2